MHKVQGRQGRIFGNRLEKKGIFLRPVVSGTNPGEKRLRTSHLSSQVSPVWPGKKGHACQEHIRQQTSCLLEPQHCPSSASLNAGYQSAPRSHWNVPLCPLWTMTCSLVRCSVPVTISGAAAEPAVVVRCPARQRGATLLSCGVRHSSLNTLGV